MAIKKRSGKFYRKNEREVMEYLGFKPTPNSGSGWLIKEDGQNESGICQLKSTDADSIRITKKDIDTLEYNALVSHKHPIFAIQFLKTNEVFILVRPEELESLLVVFKDNFLKDIHEGLSDPKKSKLSPLVEGLGLDLESEPKETQRIMKKIVSSSSSRKNFMKANEMKYKKKSKSAK